MNATPKPSPNSPHPESCLFHDPLGNADHPQNSVYDALMRYEVLDEYADLIWKDYQEMPGFIAAIRYFRGDLLRLERSVEQWFRQNCPELGLLGDETREAQRRKEAGQ